MEDKKQELRVFKRKGEGDFESTYMIRAEVVLDYPPEVVHELLCGFACGPALPVAQGGLTRVLVLAPFCCATFQTQGA